jgi:hypothetical protein
MDLFLKPHPAMPPKAARFVNVQVRRLPAGLQLLYIVEGDPARLKLPGPRKPARTDGLWRTTCFELFLAGEGTAYSELNFSPSGQWAAYRFGAYRDESEPLALNEAPTSRLLDPEPFGIMLLATVAVALEPRARFGATAVIEETDGTMSYWALAHPDPEKPDFHHPDCFALELPPFHSSSPRT